MPHWKKLINPDYLGAYSLYDRGDIILTIERVQVETITGPDGKKEDCPVCFWREREKPMILNVTNMKTISKLIGSPNTDDWSGHRIMIGVERVKAFGDVCDALRVRPQLPAAATVKCEKCGGDILPGWGMDGAQLAAYTRKKYGAALCHACATEAKNAADKE